MREIMSRSTVADDVMPSVVCADGVRRPIWADRTPLVREYYDTEWGRAVRTEAGLFELVCLLGFATGLTWASVLAKREGLRRAFAGFDPDAVAAMSEQDCERLLTDPSVIRNGDKCRAVVTNARATVALRAAGGLTRLVWGDHPVEADEGWRSSESKSKSESGTGRRTESGSGMGTTTGSGSESATGRGSVEVVSVSAMPRRSERSERLAAELSRAGFVRVGPMSAQSLLLAAGVVTVAENLGRTPTTTGAPGDGGGAPG